MYVCICMCYMCICVCVYHCRKHSFTFLDYAFILREAMKKIKAHWLVKADMKFNAERPSNDFNPAHSMCVMFLHYTVIQ